MRSTTPGPPCGSSASEEDLTRILAVADEVDQSLYSDRLSGLSPDLIVSCGDLPFDYLEYLVSRVDVPLLFVPGNHDTSLRPPDQLWAPLQVEVSLPGPRGCENIDGKIVEVGGLRIAGLGGSLRYKPGPNQYTQAQMRRRVLSLDLRLRLKQARHGRKLDVLVTHAPPLGTAAAKDAAHVGFAALHHLIDAFHPLLLVHGHIHPYGKVLPELRVGDTRVVNAVPWRLIEI